ncbi:hypothetical protein FRC07_003203 [Ceratobasidium sp. 392]|nr:hypothetical protein FRC07_003203 [Ceratobasidium sp. 392]
MSSTKQTTIIPHSQEPLVTYEYPTTAELDKIVARSVAAQKQWKNTPVAERIKIGHKFTEEFKKLDNEIPLELTKQMGRPVSQNAGEIRGTLERANYMLSIAEKALAPVGLEDTDKPGFKRYIKREPLGVVFVIAPWNFPFLTSINSLGGKDPAYVRSDADVDYTTAELVDGAFFNSGQSCCAVERIYVHDSIYDKFVSAYVDIVKKYKLGDPTEPGTNLGPVVSLASAERIRKQVDDAVKAGATPLVPEDLFPVAKPGTTYVAPQVLVNVDHSMDVMKEETFGPVVGIMRVSSDEAALELMNDSPYGLTASVWTTTKPESQEAFLRFVDELETGTVFLNRCDYLDPALAWTGVKDSGRGISLSKFGYDQLTRAKSVHMKIVTA